MTVEFELLPRTIAWIFRRYGDLPAVVDKVIMPQISSISRCKGSATAPRISSSGEGREKFQNDLTEALGAALAEKNIIVHNALIRHVKVPMQILEPIQQASIAVEQDLTNKEKQNTAKKLAELNTEQPDRAAARAGRAGNGEAQGGDQAADQEKQVAEIGAEAQKQVAEIRKQTATVRADEVPGALGQAQAQVVNLVQGETAAGHALKSAALGDPHAYTLWELANSLNADVQVNILRAGDGTLWTDVENKALGNLGGAKVLKQ